jgi:hypothetical protein
VFLCVCVGGGRQEACKVNQSNYDLVDHYLRMLTQGLVMIRKSLLSGGWI